MYTYILSVIIVSIISLCFFKKRFWENRYLILTIIGGVALIATLTINFSIRRNFEKKWIPYSKEEINTFYVNDSLLKFATDSLDKKIRVPAVTKNFKFYDEYEFEDFKLKENQRTPVSVIVYQADKEPLIGYFINGMQYYRELDKIYITLNSADNKAYHSKMKYVYDVPKNKWLPRFSVPRIKTIEVLNIPPQDYASIPDTLIRKLPY
jgi:hypothetical protein